MDCLNITLFRRIKNPLLNPRDLNKNRSSIPEFSSEDVYLEYTFPALLQKLVESRNLNRKTGVYQKSSAHGDSFSYPSAIQAN
jgi:hypothetical protein